MIEWDVNGYPTEGSLRRLRRELRMWRANLGRAIEAFYLALADPGPYGASGPERVEVGGEVRDVYGYHTGGWSGCEEVIGTLREVMAPKGNRWVWPLWDMLLQRYDRGGHYWFDLPERAQAWLGQGPERVGRHGGVRV